MRAVFAHDHRFVPFDGAVWSESQFGAELWKRYLAHFDAITVVARLKTLARGESAAALERSSAPAVEFELFPNLSTLRGLTVARPAVWARMCAIVDAHDAVIARLPSEIGQMAIDAARSCRKPWAVEIVGCAWDALWNYGSATGRIYAPFARFRMGRTVARAQHAIYVTERFLQQRYPTQASNIAAVSNVVLGDVSDEVLRERLRRIEALGSRPIRLGLIGTLRTKYKGIAPLMSAIALARPHLPPLTLHILGAGEQAPWRAEAKRLGIGSFVSFDGTLPAGSAVTQWFDEADLYLQPSLTEGLPRALIEAMSRGCPAIASNVGGIPDLLPSEDTIRPGDVVGLARLLERRLPDRDWMADSARRNWETAQRYRADRLEARRSMFWRRFAEVARDARDGSNAERWT